MRRAAIRPLLALLAGLVLLGAVGLVGWSAWQAAAEERLRHGIVAERLFDALEAELSDLVQREEQRSFLEYRHYYVPGRQAVASAVGLVRSPLADLPDPAGPILGWFQIDPDGQLYLPHAPRESEAALALGDGWTAEPALDSVRAAVHTAVDAGVGRPEPAQPANNMERQVPPPEPVQAAAPPMAQAADAYKQTVGSSLNRGVSKRSARTSRTVQTQTANLMGFLDNRAEDLREVVDPPPAPEAVQVQVDVRVEPFQGARVADTVVLHRRVEIAGEPFVQGFVVDLERLTSALSADVLTGELADFAELAWDGPALVRVHAFDHRFGAPFDGLSASVSLDRLPGETPVLLPLLVLTALLGLTLAAGVLALDRAVATELEFAQRRTDFVAAVSHELKTPLTAIRMYAEMLRDGMVLSAAHRQEYYGTIAAESERLSRLIGNVLELARLERGVAGATVVGDVGPVLSEVVDVLGPHARELGFEIELAVPPDLPTVRFDRDGLLQVLLNLVDNALKFSASADDKRVTVEAVAVDGAVRVRVRDRGPGVPAGQLDAVFEPFVRGERELTRTTKGTGIGLSLVRGLVARMGGSVRGRNHPEGGWEVTLQLPVASVGATGAGLG
ncbi:MAG: signal transduction histidine kinase [Myxococcota bacterium]|jgi:signal transduction histidine kinase